MYFLSLRNIMFLKAFKVLVQSCIIQKQYAAKTNSTHKDRTRVNLQGTNSFIDFKTFAKRRCSFMAYGVVDIEKNCREPQNPSHVLSFRICTFSKTFFNCKLSTFVRRAKSRGWRLFALVAFPRCSK